MTKIRLQDIQVTDALMHLLEDIKIVGGDITKVDETHAKKIIALIIHDGLLEDASEDTIQHVIDTGGIGLDYFPNVYSFEDIARRVIEHDTNNREEGSGSYLIGRLPKEYAPFVNVDLVAEKIAKNKMCIFVPKWHAAIYIWQRNTMNE